MFNVGELFKTQASNSPPQSPTVVKKKILVVEDERDISDVYQQILTERGYDTTVARDGQDGLNKIIQLSPELIFLDIRMPVMDGKTMLGLLKNDIRFAKFRNTPVVMLTNSGNVDNIHDTQRLGGANEFIVKSNIAPNELANIADKYLH